MLKQGLTKEYGDVDLLGFEVVSSLKNRKEILEKLISKISDLKSILLSNCIKRKKMHNSEHSVETT